MQRIASIDKVSPRVAHARQLCAPPPRTHVAALSLAVTAALLIAGCAEAPKPGLTGLYAQQARITDEAIRSDLAVLQALQGRLDKVKAKSAYHGAKAATWLDFARDEYHENDRTGVIEAATAEAAQLIDALEKGASPGMDTALVAGSVKLRELGLTPREFELVRTSSASDGSVLVKKGNESIMAKMNLTGMDNMLSVLSASTDNVMICRECIREFGPNPRDWLPRFYERRI